MDSSPVAEAEVSSESTPPYPQESLARARNLSLLFPFLLGFATAAPSQGPREAVVIIDPLRQSMSVIVTDGPGDLEAVLRELSNEDGPSPASKASIQAMPVVKVTEEGAECAICLTEYEVGGEAKEMPCKHKYHSVCIDKWLGTHGSCPVCRHQMPVDEEENKKRSNGSDRERRIGEGDIQIRFFVAVGGSPNSYPNSNEAVNNSSDSRDASGSIQDREIDSN